MGIECYLEIAVGVGGACIYEDARAVFIEVIGAVAQVNAVALVGAGEVQVGVQSQAGQQAVGQYGVGAEVGYAGHLGQLASKVFCLEEVEPLHGEVSFEGAAAVGGGELGTNVLALGGVGVQVLQGVDKVLRAVIKAVQLQVESRQQAAAA